MSRSSTAGTGRIVRQMMVVGMVALLLGAVAASPAAANQRGDAVTAANDFIWRCFATGGTPIPMTSSDEMIIVYCAFDNGSVKKCAYSASSGWVEDCWWYYPWVPNSDDGHGVDGGDQFTQGGAAGNPRPPTPVNGGGSTSIGTRSGDLGDEQGTSACGKATDEKHHKDKDKGKNKHKNKRHGKANASHKGGKAK